MKKILLSLFLLPLTANVAAQEGVAQLEKAYQQSAFSLFNAVAQNEADNVCFSPLSLQMALSMVQHGAAGNTLQQMQQVLGTKGFSNEQIGEFNRLLSKQLTERPPYDEEFYRNYDPENPQEAYNGLYPICELANALWRRPDVELYEDFLQALLTYYESPAEAVEFSTWDGVDRINGWVSDHTHGLIPKIYHEPQSEDLAVVLTNALYFKGSWTFPFDEEATEVQPFWLDDESFVRADMMSLLETLDCSATPSFQTVTLPYGDEGTFSMTLFVPKEGTQLPPLTYEDWSAATQSRHWQPLHLRMPRFEVDGNYDLTGVLADLGMKDAFDKSADFTKMCETKRKIDKVSQLSKIIVNEKGTEAAAITVIEMCDGMGPDPDSFQDFTVDRPFYFTIQNSKQDAVLFVGRVTQLPGTVEYLAGVSAVGQQKKAGRCYDLQGRSLQRVPQKGVYIQDGQKRVTF